MGTSKVKFDFNPIKGVKFKNKTQKKRTVVQIKKFIKSETIRIAKSGKSPTDAQSKYPKLSKKYAIAKKGGDRTRNLTLQDIMLNSIRINKTGRGNQLRITVNKPQQGKADGHNNFSGKSKLKTAKFIPDARKKEDFDSKIIKGIDKIINKHVE